MGRRAARAGWRAALLAGLAACAPAAPREDAPPPDAPAAPPAPPPGAVRVGPDDWRIPGAAGPDGCRAWRAWSAAGPALTVTYYRRPDGGFTRTRPEACE